VACPGSFGVKSPLSAPEVPQFDQFVAGNRDKRNALEASSRSAPAAGENCRSELGYFGGNGSRIGTEQRVTVTRVGPLEPGTKTSSERQPVR
jgi:hypothetical protein